MKHIIYFKPYVNPFQHVLCKNHPGMKLVVKGEINKFLVAKLIFMIRQNIWVEIIVQVRNKMDTLDTVSISII